MHTIIQHALKAHRILVIALSFLVSAHAAQAQVDKEERKELSTERRSRAKDRVDWNLFRRQMLTLKEYSDERRKNKPPAKIVTIVDTNDDGGDTKPRILNGYITLLSGDNTVNLYEVTYDRVQKAITSVKRTQEAAEMEKEEPTTRTTKPTKEKPEAKEKPGTKPPAKPVVKRKPVKKGTDEDDEEETEEEPDEEEKEEKPTRKKQKDDDE